MKKKFLKCPRCKWESYESLPSHSYCHNCDYNTVEEIDYGKDYDLIRRDRNLIQEMLSSGRVKVQKMPPEKVKIVNSACCKKENKTLNDFMTRNR